MEASAARSVGKAASSRRWSLVRAEASRTQTRRTSKGGHSSLAPSWVTAAPPSFY